MKKRFYIAVLCGAIWATGMMLSCDKDKQLPPEDTVERVLPPIEDIDGGEEDPDGEKDYFHGINFLHVENVDTDGSGIDLATGKVFRGRDVHNNIHAIDLLYLDFGNATNSNIALPESRELSVNEYGENIQYGWRHKNAGVLYRLEDVQPRDVEWFNGAKSAVRISAVVDSMITVLSADPGNKKQRYRNVQKDQILIFKSTDRNIASLIYVNHRGTTTNGSNLRLVIKTDATQLQEIPPVTGGLLNANGNFYADVMEVNFDVNLDHDEFYFDFENKRVYKQSELDAMDDYSMIHVLFGRRKTTTDLYLFTPTGTAAMSSNYGNSALSAYLSGRSDRKTWRLMRINGLAAYISSNNFESTRLNNKAIQMFYASLGNSTSWTSHFSTAAQRTDLMNNGVYRISNRIPYVNASDPGSGLVADIPFDSGLYFGIFKIKEYDSVTGKLVIEVKYFNSLD